MGAWTNLAVLVLRVCKCVCGLIRVGFLEGVGVSSGRDAWTGLSWVVGVSKFEEDNVFCGME